MLSRAYFTLGRGGSHLAVVFFGALALVATAETSTVQAPLGAKRPEPTKEKLDPPEGAKPFPAAVDLWIDQKNHAVYVDGVVSLRRGPLELFACPRGTKEHESIVAVNSQAYLIHTALLAVGCKSGHPVQHHPTYKAATGDKISVEVIWRDPKTGKEKRMPAQKWIRNVKTDETITDDWVFGGSGFWTDEETGAKHYMASQGELICVSNFGAAMLDLPIESTQSNDGLMFAAHASNIPPLGTPVRLVLKKKVEDEKKAAEKNVEKAEKDEKE